MLRRFAPPEIGSSVWIAVRPFVRDDYGRVATVPGNGEPWRRWVRKYDLRDDVGKPLAIHRGRIRATYENLLARRGWTGRTTIDPNHTPRVEGDHYLSATTPAQQDAVDSIIESGQADVLRKALPPVVLSDAQTAELVENFPAAVSRWGVDDPAISELVGGQRDVFTAACADQLAGQWGPVGKPCPARPWVCLLCPLAVFMPRHAPNLLRLKAFFARQFRQMTTEEFLRIFGRYADRLDTEILPRMGEDVLAQAAETVHDTDNDLPLRAEESTS